MTGQWKFEYGHSSVTFTWSSIRMRFHQLADPSNVSWSVFAWKWNLNDRSKMLCLFALIVHLSLGPVDCFQFAPLFEFRDPSELFENGAQCASRSIFGILKDRSWIPTNCLEMMPIASRWYQSPREEITFLGKSVFEMTGRNSCCCLLDFNFATSCLRRCLFVSCPVENCYVESSIIDQIATWRMATWRL